MNTFLIILLVLAVIATVVALVRGIVAFLQTTEADLKGEGVSQSALKQNKMMQARVGFQALAIVIVVLILALAGSGR